jgi:hypothetical protein
VVIITGLHKLLRAACVWYVAFQFRHIYCVSDTFVHVGLNPLHSISDM